jgi:hypothetical protein
VSGESQTINFLLFLGKWRSVEISEAHSLVRYQYFIFAVTKAVQAAVIFSSLGGRSNLPEL